MLALRSHYIKW